VIAVAIRNGHRKAPYSPRGHLTATNEATEKIGFRSLAKIPVVVFLIVWAISVGYMGTHLKRGWVPHDEGTLGQEAERTLNGDIPHRDFDDYTGGVTFVHALAFRELGISSGTMRIVLFIFFVAWVPAVYYAVSRFSGTYAAGALTFLAVAWSVPNYPGPMPSWYNLFFATFGLAALLRYLEVNSRRWLVIAGICGGLSFLAKVTAAYYVAGVLLFFVFREQSISDDENRGSGKLVRLYSFSVALLLAIFISLLFRLVHKLPGIAELVYFVLPSFLLVALLLGREFAGVAGNDRGRFATLMDMCVPFGAGFVLPIIPFVMTYALLGSVHALILGLLAMPATHVLFATRAPLRAEMMVTAVPFILPVVLAYDCRRVGRIICAGVLALCASAVLILSVRNPVIYRTGWYSLALAIPWLVFSGVAVLWVARDRKNISPLRQQQIMLLMSLAALCSVIQFPFASPVYFFFAAPLVILFGSALFASAAKPPRLALGVLAGFYLLLVVLRITPGFVRHIGYYYTPDAQTARLSLERARGLRVEPGIVQVYEELIPLVQTHARGKFIYAAPDCPELYFLSGLQSPTRHLYGFAEDPMGQADRIMSLLESRDVNLVVIKGDPEFSGQISPELREMLERRYLYSAQVGTFEVRWRK